MARRQLHALELTRDQRRIWCRYRQLLAELGHGELLSHSATTHGHIECQGDVYES